MKKYIPKVLGVLMAYAALMSCIVYFNTYNLDKLTIGVLGSIIALCMFNMEIKTKEDQEADIIKDILYDLYVKNFKEAP